MRRALLPAVTSPNDQPGEPVEIHTGGAKSSAPKAKGTEGPEERKSEKKS